MNCLNGLNPSDVKDLIMTAMGVALMMFLFWRI